MGGQDAHPIAGRLGILPNIAVRSLLHQNNMVNDSKQKGQESEHLVEDFLTFNGLEIVERNFSCKLGEVDLIARDGKYFVFVEVRSVTEGFIVHPLESITKKKRSKIIKTATWYLKQAGLLGKVSIRFDVVTIVWRSDGSPLVSWLKGAFTA